MLVMGAIAIGFAPIFVRLSEVGPTATGFWRTALAAPLLWAWMLSEAQSPRPPRQPVLSDLPRLALPGLFFAADLFCWHWSIHYTSVTNATLLSNVAPVFVTLASWWLFGERFTPTFLGGLALAIGGVVVLMGDSLSLGRTNLAGDALGVATAVFYGGYLLSVGRLRATFSTATVVAWSALVTAAALLPAAVLTGEGLPPASLRGWLILLGLAWLSHAGGQTLIAFALAHLPAAFSSVSLLVQPVAAAVLAWALLAEPLGEWQGLGGAIVLAGVLLARRGAGRRPGSASGRAPARAGRAR